jgi:hypothetical protein
VALPDFFVIGAPKAGTSALHAALATHPDLYLSPVKEPKYFLCGDVPPTRGQNGPGDAHSAREWIWRRDRYEALFAPAPEGVPKGESTPFYLYELDAQRRIAEAVPHAKLIAIVRDPVDRAYSNWMHLWSDGLEPIPDFLDACAAEDERIERGWAPFWHYKAQGRYGEQLQRLHELFPAEQIHVLRYRDLVDAPGSTLDSIAAFLDVGPGRMTLPGPENTRPFAAPGWRTDALGPIIRAGAAAGAYAPPRAWRRASTPLTWALQHGGGTRPKLDVAARRQLVAHFADDIGLLGTVVGRPFDDWLSDSARGDFASRRADQDAGP